MEEIIFTDIIKYVSNKIANLEQDAGLFFNLCVKLNNDTLITAHHNMKLLVRLIVDEIEEGDGYKWMFTTRPTISVHHSGI
ncbi:8133_t:CDS:2, partial [Ambispora gerdemannii]